VFTAGPRICGRDYEPFLGIIRNALAEIPTVSAHVSQQWTRYVVNGIPTTTWPEDAREDLELLYPTAKLAKTPRWLTTVENRQEKAASSMVITLVGRTKLSKMLLFNRECDIREYIPFRDTTQCSQCQGFGHPLLSAKPPPHAPSAGNRTSPTSTRATSPAARKDAAVRTRRFAALYASNRIRPRTGRAPLFSLSHAARISSSQNRVMRRPRVMRRARLPRRIRR
jgi:hypothetical protein